MRKKKYLVPMWLGREGCSYACPLDMSLVKDWPSDGHGFGFARIEVSIWGNADGDYPMPSLEILSSSKGIGLLGGQMVFVPMLAMKRIEPEGEPLDLETATSAINGTVRSIIQSEAAGKGKRFPRHWTVFVEVEMVESNSGAPLNGVSKRFMRF